MHAGRAANRFTNAERRRAPRAFTEFAMRALLVDQASLADVRAAALRIQLPETVTKDAFAENLD
jgi:hypothetical protein